jgi:hypothetical protein
MRRQLIIAPLVSLVGCSMYVDDLLTIAEADVVESGESPGGDDAPDDPGEGEGEGQDPDTVEDDDDPACEANERLLVVRDQEVDALRVYALDDGGLVRRFPTGTTANVNVDNDDTAAQSNGWGLTGVALGQDQYLYVVGDRFLYRFDSRDLTQQTLTGRVQVTLENFGQASFVEVIGDSVLTFGDNVRRLPQDAEVGAAAELLHQGDDYLGTTTFRIGTTHYVAASASYGYVVIAAEEGGPPQVVQVVDTEFDTERIHSFGSSVFRKGIAFDAATRTLLVGDQGRVIVVSAEGQFVLPTDDAGDYVLADGATPDVAGIAARGGFAWVLLRRARDNIIKIDLSQRPPRGVALATVPVESFGRAIVAGCRRVFVVGADRVVALDRETLAQSSSLPIEDVENIRIVRRTELALAGDE